MDTSGFRPVGTGLTVYEDEQVVEGPAVWLDSPADVIDFVANGEVEESIVIAPGVFGMGLLHAGMLGIRLARWVGPLNVRRFAVRFTGQVWPGDELTFTGRVVAVAGDGADVELEVTRQTGDVALRATAHVAVSATV